MERFLQTLHNQNFSLSNEDKLLLKDVREEGFSVKIMYNYRSVWNPVVPPKIGRVFGFAFSAGCSCSVTCPGLFWSPFIHVLCTLGNYFSL